MESTQDDNCENNATSKKVIKDKLNIETGPIMLGAEWSGKSLRKPIPSSGIKQAKKNKNIEQYPPKESIDSDELKSKKDEDTINEPKDYNPVCLFNPLMPPGKIVVKRRSASELIVIRTSYLKRLFEESLYLMRIFNNIENDLESCNTFVVNGGEFISLRRNKHDKDRIIAVDLPNEKISLLSRLFTDKHKHLYCRSMGIVEYNSEFVATKMDFEEIEKLVSKLRKDFGTKVSKASDEEKLKSFKPQINKDAHVYNPATNVVVYPENFGINATNEISRTYNSIVVEPEEAYTSGSSSNSRPITGQADEELIDEFSETKDKIAVEVDSSSRNAPSSDSSTTAPSTSRQETTLANNASESPPQPTDLTEQNDDKKIKNSRPLSQEATTYELNKFSKNAMLVINQEEVEGYPELRRGTTDDVTALKLTFGNFAFVVEDHKDKTIREVFTILREFSERDFTDYGCIAVAILTHGTRFGLLRAKDLDQMYSELAVLNFLKVSNNPTLATKPIILIIQACRGDDDSIGVPVNTELKIRKDLDGDVEPYYLPLHADTLVLHSSFYGKPSFRPENGTWFIQTLCEKINKLSPTHDLISIITEVQREVATKKEFIEYSLKSMEIEVNKQMPVMTSTLLRKLFLMKGEAEHFQTKSSQTSCDTTDGSCHLNNTSIKHDLMGVKVPCSCFVRHFNYLKNCLSHFVDENPIDRKDSTARYLLKDANTINENYNLSKAKTTLIAISNFLENNSRLSPYHKYLYFYRVHDVDSDSCNGKMAIWRTLRQNYVPIAACTISFFLLRQMEEWFL